MPKQTKDGRAGRSKTVDKKATGRNAAEPKATTAPRTARVTLTSGHLAQLTSGTVLQIRLRNVAGEEQILELMVKL